MSLVTQRGKVPPQKLAVVQLVFKFIPTPIEDPLQVPTPPPHYLPPAIEMPHRVTTVMKQRCKTKQQYLRVLYVSREMPCDLPLHRPLDAGNPSQSLQVELGWLQAARTEVELALANVSLRICSIFPN